MLRFFRLKRVSSAFGGLVYITTPIFFDYTIMGWVFVILAMGLMPLSIKYFIKAFKENKPTYAFLTGIIYTLAIIQAQALFWIIFILACTSIYLIKDKQTFWRYLKILTIVVATFILLNSYWVLGIFFSPDQRISGTDIVNSAVSIGTLGHFTPKNIIRLFGALFNFQYENLINFSNLLLMSFVVPVLVFMSLMIKKNKRLISFFWLIGLIPIFFYFINFFRDFLIYVPFSNVIRDFARFTTLSTLSYAALIGIVFNQLIRKRGSASKILATLIVIIWLFSIYPWWTNELTNWEKHTGSNMRLRTKVFPEEYIKAENQLSKKKLDQKAIFIPIGGTVDFLDDSRFHGIYNETQDIFAGYSPVPGVLNLNDRSQGILNAYVSAIIKNRLDIDEILGLSNINYFIIRKNLKLKDKYLLLDNLKEKGEQGILKKIEENDELMIYKKTTFLPHFYTPKNLVFSKRDLEEFPRILSRDDWQTRSAVFFEEQNTDKISKLSSLKDKSYQAPTPPQSSPQAGEEDLLPILEFKKINPTKYRIRVHGATQEFPLVFSESFHEGWKIYLSDEIATASPRNDIEKYKILDGNDDDPKSRIGDGASQASILDNYKILDGNEDDQADINELKEYIQKGWVSNLGDGQEKEIKHLTWENNKEKLDYTEKYNIDFVSKNFQETIQNENLPSGHIWETWFQEPIDNNENHLMVNGYANSWVIDPTDICQQVESLKSSGSQDSICVKNPDGSYDFEVVVEFWPQRLFYIGLGISGTTLILCLAYLIYDYRKNRKPEVASPKE